MNIEEEKAKIRKEIKRRRQELSSNILATIEKDIPGFIFSIDDSELKSVIKKAKRIALYRAVNGEVPVDGLAEAFMQKGLKCCFPRVEGDNMVFCDCDSLDDKAFKVSSYGIREPADHIPAVDPKDIDVVVLPAVAYNEEGTRLGMGGGYYDRFIGACAKERPYLLGICYEFQICSDVPSSDHDISADFIAVIPEENYTE